MSFLFTLHPLGGLAPPQSKMAAECLLVGGQPERSAPIGRRVLALWINPEGPLEKPRPGKRQEEEDDATLPLHFTRNCDTAD